MNGLSGCGKSREGNIIVTESTRKVSESALTIPQATPRVPLPSNSSGIGYDLFDDPELSYNPKLSYSGLEYRYDSSNDDISAAPANVFLTEDNDWKQPEQNVYYGAYGQSSNLSQSRYRINSKGKQVWESRGPELKSDAVRPSEHSATGTSSHSVDHSESQNDSYAVEGRRPDSPTPWTVRERTPTPPYQELQSPPPLAMSAPLTRNPTNRYISGTQGEYELLDHEFKIHKSKTFKPGQVFKIIWAEPKGEALDTASDSGRTDVTCEAWSHDDGVTRYSGVRRFIVTATGNGFSDCIPIITYGRQGLAKPGIDLDTHAIIYSTSEPPELAVKWHLNPIRFVGKTPRDTLDVQSLINYSKIYPVEHNVKVQWIGWIAQNSQLQFVKDFNLVWETLNATKGASMLPLENDPDAEIATSVGTSFPISPQQFEIFKAARKPVIHLLAIGPISQKALRDKLPNISTKNFKQLLDKVGDEVNGKYELKKIYFKELDVWTFEYEEGDRQRAIDNAIKQYDKARLGISEPEWDRLLVKSERGTGKCLSKLQARIAQYSAKAPKGQVQKADGREYLNALTTQETVAETQENWTEQTDTPALLTSQEELSSQTENELPNHSPKPASIDEINHVDSNDSPPGLSDEETSLGTLSSAKSDSIKDDLFSEKAKVSTHQTSNSSEAHQILDASCNDDGIQDAPETRGDDIRSLISDNDDTHSKSSAKKTKEELVAQEHLAILIAKSPQLSGVYEIGLTKLGRERFVKNIRKLLMTFYSDLQPQATTNLQQATLHLLRSRWSRIRIAERIVSVLLQEDEDQTNDVARGQFGFPVDFGQELDHEQKLADLERWLANNKAFNQASAPPPEIIGIDDQFHHEGSSDEGEGNDSEDDENEIFGQLTQARMLPNISEMESFVMGGDPFKKFHLNLQLFLIPGSLASLTRILMSIPSDRVHFSTNNDNSPANRAKLYFEECIGTELNWWPLTQPMRNLKDGETRMHWRCHCNQDLWTEITDAQAADYKALLDVRGNRLQHNHLCKKRLPRKAIKIASTDLLYAISQTIRELFQWKSLSSRAPSSEAATPGNSAASQGNVPASSSSGNASTVSSGHTSSEASSVTGASSPTSSINPQNVNINGGANNIKQLWVFFGVQRSRPTVMLDQLDTEKYANDDKFFQVLKQRYGHMRGFWKSWFSIWRLSYCDFVKFEKIRANRIIRRKIGLPTDPNYQYDPRPPNGEDPPISPHEFELAFMACQPSCPLSWLHECIERPQDKFAIQRIPKRTSALEIKVGQPEFAWGIQAQNSVSVVGIVVYHVLILVGPFAFWGWWMHYQPGDLQNAVVPVTIAVVLISLFWASAGVLSVLKDPVHI